MLLHGLWSALWTIRSKECWLIAGFLKGYSGKLIQHLFEVNMKLWFRNRFSLGELLSGSHLYKAERTALSFTLFWNLLLVGCQCRTLSFRGCFYLPLDVSRGEGQQSVMPPPWFFHHLLLWQHHSPVEHWELQHSWHSTAPQHPQQCKIPGFGHRLALGVALFLCISIPKLRPRLLWTFNSTQASLEVEHKSSKICGPEET